MRRRRLLAGAVVAVLATGAIGFELVARAPASSAAGADNSSPTALATVTRRDLSSQTQVSATLGYADSSTVVQPAGTAPTALTQALQAASTAADSFAAAQRTLTADRQTLVRDQALLAAARAKQAVDCAGADAAGTACTADQQSVATAAQAATADMSKVSADEAQTSAARRGLSDAAKELSDAQSSATVYGQSSTYTALPAVGAIVRPGRALYSISGEPVLLLAGSIAPWRAFAPGMSPGRDVAELNASLRALGFRDGRGDRFTAETAAAIEKLQASHGLEETGELLLGAVVFEPGPVRVTSVTPSLGATVQAGPVLGITSTVRQVKIALDAAQQSQIAVGDPVTITLPDNSTTPGRVSAVGTVATTPSGDQGGGSSPTIEVDVAPTDPAATGRLDQAPVSVSITTDTVRNVLVVPVNALLALASGGYAVEVSEPGGARRLVAAEPGLFDDAEGLVQVSGSRLRVGQRVVVPAG